MDMSHQITSLASLHRTQKLGNQAKAPWELNIEPNRCKMPVLPTEPAKKQTNKKTVLPTNPACCLLNYRQGETSTPMCTIQNFSYTGVQQRNVARQAHPVKTPTSFRPNRLSLLMIRCHCNPYRSRIKNPVLSIFLGPN